MDQPTLVFDDDCSFCTRVARAIERHAPVAIVGFSELEPALARRLPSGYRQCVHFVTVDAVYSCGEAVERAVAEIEGFPKHSLSILRLVPGYEIARERGYGFVAKRRGTFGRLLP